MKTLILLVLVGVLGSTGAWADLPSAGTVGLYLVQGENELTRAGVVKIGTPFEIVIQTNADYESMGGLFGMTELSLLYPGIFKVGTSKVNDTTFDLGDNDIGEYVLAYTECEAAGPLEVVRVGYVDINGDLPEDVVLYVGGVSDDDKHNKDIDGAPGFVSCSESAWLTMFSLVPEPWDSSSNIDPTAIDGVTVTDGLLVLNPSRRVPVFSSTVGTLKAQF